MDQNNPFGYKGGKKNRTFSPEQVTMIREAVAKGEGTPAYFAQMFEVGVETIRRIVRRETYGDVGARLGGPPDVERPGWKYAPPPTELELAAQESARRMHKMLVEGTLKVTPEAEPPPQKVDIGKLLHGFETPGVEPDEQAESALERFMRETKAAKAASPDALVEELKTAAPTDSGEQAGDARE